jgi:NADPH-dependent curcumin reductase CurA
MGGAGSEEKAVVENREWYLAAYAPEGVPTSDHLKLRTVPLSLAVDSIPDRHLVVQNLLISVDPYQRTRLTGLEDGLYFPQFKLNEVLETNFTLTPLQIYKYNAL